MAIIVQKFGGTSVADVERIRHVATRVKHEVDAGNQVAVVVSAMAGVTDQLVGYANEVSTLNSDEAFADYDMVVSSGEQVTSGLLALTLKEMGIPARAWAGWQIGMKTDDAHGKARILDIDTNALEASLNERNVAVVAGFQGIGPDGRVTTLGRGGSDTSAVALAGALKAERCDIYTDVDGIYTTDPRIVSKARKLRKVAYEEILEMASLGAKILQTRSVEMAMNYGVRTQVRSTFEDTEGTELVDEEEVVERRRVTGITYSRDDARISLTQVANRPGVSARIFGPLAEANVNVDMIVQNVTEDGMETDVTFTLPKGDVERSVNVLEVHKDAIQFKSIHTDKNVAKISVIGVGMRSHAGVASEMFQTLADKNINIIVITTSEIKVSVLVEEEYTELAVRSLHTAYGLDAEVA
jgi:aspartate kinase